MASVKNIEFIKGSSSPKISDQDQSKLLIKPRQKCEVDEVKQTVELEYKIITPNINLEIQDPDQEVTIPGKFKTFSKPIQFVKKESGEKKNFHIKVIARLDSSEDTDILEIYYD